MIFFAGVIVGFLIWPASVFALTMYVIYLENRKGSQ